LALFQWEDIGSAGLPSKSLLLGLSMGDIGPVQLGKQLANSASCIRELKPRGVHNHVDFYEKVPTIAMPYSIFQAWHTNRSHS
jgi:hypothetical protein